MLARTIRLATSGELAVVIDRIAAIAGNAGMMDHSGTPHTGAGSFYSASTGLQQASAGAVFNSGFTGIAYSASTEQYTTVSSTQGTMPAMKSSAIEVSVHTP